MKQSLINQLSHAITEFPDEELKKTAENEALSKLYDRKGHKILLDSSDDEI